MRVAAFLAAFALLGATAATDTKSDVVSLTKDTFSKFVEDEKLSLIEFFAPWCALAPEYEVAATELKDKIPIAKVDCTVETEVCEQLEVRGYPTLKVFRDGKPSDYKGARKADSIVSYMKKQALPAVSVLSADEVEDFAASDKVVVIGFFPSLEGADFAAFNEVANQYRDDFLFGATEDDAVASSNAVSAPGIVLFKKFDEGKNVFGGKFEAEAIVDFVKENSVPLMDEIGPETYGDYVERGLPIAYLFYSNDEERKTFGAEVEPVAAEFKGKVSFVYIDANKFGGHGNNLNLKSEWPAFAVQEAKKNLKYPFDQSKKITKDAISAFVKSIVDGTLEPSLKSAPVPESNDGPVTVVVGSTFEQIVLDTTKDVFIELYAPWCGHCKKLAPIWDELGEKFKGSNVVIAKMDATENDLPASSPYRVEGFPTLKLYKANSNEIVDYDGDRTLISLIDFVKKNGVHGEAVTVQDTEGSESRADEDGHDEL
ncbi:thioredoxin-like domain-containing protein [Cladochytrium replicatum]|nr:thioredoxin-like domain-containing protein [Cladochytrium replicatum]